MAKRKTKKRTTKKKNFLSRLIGCLLLAVILINLVENFIIVKKKYTIESDKFAGGFSGATIVQLSDVHLVKNKWDYNLILRETKSSNPDIIVITGDLIDSRHYENEEYINLTVDLCKDLASIAPVYYVYGNHENRIRSEKEIFDAIQSAGVIDFNNQHQSFQLNGGTINLMGVSDPSYDVLTESIETKEELLSTKLNALTATLDENIFTILLSHRPELFDMYTNTYGIDLTLTGHTHGGQIRLPFSDIAAYAPGQGILPEYSAGLYQSNGNYMIISRGIGESRFPFRIFDTPEVVVIQLETGAK